MLKRIADAGLEGQVVVDSAGTHDYHVGEAPDPRTLYHAARRGYDLSTLRARQFQVLDYDRFDLVLAMDRGHHGRLLEGARQHQAGKLQLFLDYAPGLQGHEVPDPYYGGSADFERVLDLVESAVSGLLLRLRAVDLSNGGV